MGGEEGGEGLVVGEGGLEQEGGGRGEVVEEGGLVGGVNHTLEYVQVVELLEFATEIFLLLLLEEGGAMNHFTHKFFHNLLSLLLWNNFKLLL